MMHAMILCRCTELHCCRASGIARIFEHVPGVANVLADGLSRVFEPGADTTLPPQLSDAIRRTVPTRKQSFYQSLATK